MLRRTGLAPVLGLFPGPVEGSLPQNLSCIRHEGSYESSFQLARNSQPPRAARHIRPVFCMSRGAVDYRLHWLDERRNTCGKNKFACNSIGNTHAKHHQHEFWKCCNGIEQSADLDPDEHRHRDDYDFPSEYHRRGFQRCGRNAFGFHRCRPEQWLSSSICSDGLRKRFRKYIRSQRCDEFSTCYLS